mgnify:FL=1
MKNTERSVFEKNLTALAEIYGIEISHERMAGYWELLRDLSLASFSYAVRIAGQSCKFFPVPAEIRIYAKDYSPPQTFALSEGDGVPMPLKIKKRLDVLFKKIRPT